jgi:hypothetical protein
MWHSTYMTTTRTITITETGAPSRSKGRGWARIEGVEGSFASPGGRTVDTDEDTIDVVIGVELRRGQRAVKEREVVTLVVTGDPADTATVSLGSPQSYDVTVSGARHAEAPRAAVPAQAPTLRRIELAEVTPGMTLVISGRTIVVTSVAPGPLAGEYLIQTASSGPVYYRPSSGGFLRTPDNG